MARVYLVDGTFELFRCFYGAPRAADAEGRECGAVRGLLFTLSSLLLTPGLSHVAVAFDRVPKPARTGPEDDRLLQSQLAVAHEVVRGLGITLWPMVRYQADDALATGAARLHGLPEVEQVVICTTDKDLLQCIRGSAVVLLDRIRKRTTDETGLRKRFGVAPASIPDYHALVGDPSDGLPGIPGWGAKSTAKLLDRYGHIEEIPDDHRRWQLKVRGAERLARSLRERRAEALLARDLSILHDDLPLAQALAPLAWQAPPREALDALIARIGGGEVRDWFAEAGRW